MQTELFPLLIVNEYPFSKKTAVLDRKVQAWDGQTYAVKHSKPDGCIPANEWICANIAHQIGIAVPPWRLLKDFDGSIVFGSRWESSLALPDSALAPWNHVEDPAIYSSILVFDLLLANVDRHYANMLYQNVEGRLKILAFDHSHALLHNNPLPPPDQILFTPRRQQKALLQLHMLLGRKIDQKRVAVTLENFCNLNKNFYNQALEPCHNWLTTDQCDKLLAWLSNRHLCAETIRTMLEETSYDPIQILSRFPRT